MSTEYTPTEDPFPADSPVLVWYPPPGADEHDRDAWAWLPGTIIDRCGDDEWYIVIDHPALAEPDDTVPPEKAWDYPFYPTCFRDSSEIQAVTLNEWHRALPESPHG